ncbi:DNA-directed RNA polymerase II subunit GRINL1A [Cephus cinctus]|uniref:DNA-directed RNA polymerase II subunit GRINL1A n=1 Tax=Cephus cinctus TaxID=211228 RepID=A0AAJ7CB54_CEPCN|nr:DNA-directed RNA polymerase II subunit GRINL1A [Cephus cinctus]
MHQEKIIKKIPGDIPPPSKNEHVGYIDDLSKKEKFELEELLQRQTKLLLNKNFIAKLPDKGQKITKFRNKIIVELKHRNDVEDAAKLLSRLNIAAEGKVAMNEMEWRGNYTDKSAGIKVAELDSDDEDDPLKILAQPTGSGTHKRKIIQLAPAKSLITREDLEEIESFKKAEHVNMKHVNYIVNKVERPQESHEQKKREPFKPFKTTKSNVHDPAKERERKKHKHWEVTAATPPFTVHGIGKLLDLQESLRLQMEQVDRLQKVHAQHAAERLLEQFGSHSLGDVPVNVGNYRSNIEKGLSSSASSSDDEEQHEIHDDEADKAGTVFVTTGTIDT